MASPSLPSTYEPSHVIQLLVQLQKDITIVSTKLDRAIEDIGELENHVDELRGNLNFVRGSLLTAGASLVIFGSVFWWFFGDQITEIRDKLYVRPNAVEQQQ